MGSRNCIVVATAFVAMEASAEVLDKFGGCHIYHLQKLQLVLITIAVGLLCKKSTRAAVPYTLVATALLPLLSPALLKPVWPFAVDSVQVALLSELRACQGYKIISPQSQILMVSFSAGLLALGLKVRTRRYQKGIT